MCLKCMSLLSSCQGSRLVHGTFFHCFRTSHVWEQTKWNSSGKCQNLAGDAFWLLQCSNYADETYGSSLKMVTSHSTNISMDMLWTTFLAWLISWFGDIFGLHSLGTWQSWTCWMLFFKTCQTAREELKTLQKTFLLFQGKSYRRHYATYFLWWTDVLLVKVIWQALFLKYGYLCIFTDLSELSEYFGIVVDIQLENTFFLLSILVIQ